jgi:hypothetical protein
VRCAQPTPQHLLRRTDQTFKLASAEAMDAWQMGAKTRMLVLAVVTGAIVLATELSASAGYRWVAYRNRDCAGAYAAGLVCNTAILARPNPALCGPETVNLIAACGDQVPPFPLPAGCHFFQCPYHADLLNCLGPNAAADGPVFVCKRR